jgi:hypothetical protein
MDNIKDLLNRAVKNGCIVKNGGKHIKVYSPDRKKLVMVARSPSDKRALLNIHNTFKKVLGIN